MHTRVSTSWRHSRRPIAAAGGARATKEGSRFFAYVAPEHLPRSRRRCRNPARCMPLAIADLMANGQVLGVAVAAFSSRAEYAPAWRPEASHARRTPSKAPHRGAASPRFCTFCPGYAPNGSRWRFSVKTTGGAAQPLVGCFFHAGVITQVWQAGYQEDE